MADKIPVKANITGGAATSLGEFAADDTVPVANGGTGATTAAAARTALDVEQATAAGTTTQYWRGDKTWRDFAADVRTTVLTGLSTASAAAVAATDSVLVAFGKLQAQVTARAMKGSNSDITALTGLTTALSAAQGGTDYAGGAWTTFPSNPFPSSGAFGAATGSVNYLKIGRLCIFQVEMLITGIGSATGATSFLLPFPVSRTHVFGGGETSSTGKGLQGIVPGGTAQCLLKFYDGTDVTGSPRSLRFSGVCETST